MVFGIIPECRSASLRNERSASPESHQRRQRGLLSSSFRRASKTGGGQRSSSATENFRGAAGERQEGDLAGVVGAKHSVRMNLESGDHAHGCTKPEGSRPAIPVGRKPFSPT